MWTWFVSKLTFINFFLLSIILIALPNLDGVPEYDIHAPGGWMRTVAACYLLISSVILLFSDPAKRRLVQVLAWGTLGAGSFFFVSVSPVWPFWLAIGFAGVTQSIRKATGTERNVIIISDEDCSTVQSRCPLLKDRDG